MSGVMMTQTECQSPDMNLIVAATRYLRDNFSIRKCERGKKVIVLAAKDGCFPFGEDELEDVKYGEENEDISHKKTLIRKLFPALDIKESPSVIPCFSEVILVFKTSDAYESAVKLLQELCPGTVIPHVSLAHVHSRGRE